MRYSGPFQRALGRSVQTRTLDIVWRRRRSRAPNLRNVSRALGVSYRHVVNIVAGLERLGLVVVSRRGNVSWLRPNMESATVRDIARRGVR